MQLRIIANPVDTLQIFYTEVKLPLSYLEFLDGVRHRLTVDGNFPKPRLTTGDSVVIMVNKVVFLFFSHLTSPCFGVRL